MSLSDALSTANSGLQATQAAMSLVASNIANAQTPGYVRKTLVQEATTAGDANSSVRVASIGRELDQYVQKQLRVENAGGAYASTKSDFYSRLQGIYGDPSSDTALPTLFSNLTSSLQDLSNNPSSTASRSSVISSAQVLAQSLNSMSAGIQSLRSDAESGISDAVSSANSAMQQIATLNSQISNSPPGSASTAGWEDQRDYYVSQLSSLMDIRVVTGDNNQYNVFTNSGVQLVGTKASVLAFNAQGTVTPSTTWSSDPSQSTLGTLTLQTPGGGSVDLIANQSIRSGKIAALIEMRDKTLVQAQSQLDGFATAMAKSLSDTTTAGTAVTSGAQSGFIVDVGGLQSGNTVNLTYTDTLTGKQHNVSIVRVDDPKALPLTDSATIDPNDEVVGIDFSGGLASVVSQLNSKFSGKLQFSNPSGSTLQVLDDGASNRADVNSLSATQTASGFSSGAAGLPFFADATGAYSGAFTASGSQSVGFAGRITVNPNLVSDPSQLVFYSSSTQVGDPTRPNFIYDRLTNASSSFSTATGLGTTKAPFSGSLSNYLQQVLSQQGNAAANASSLSTGQSVVVNALQQRAADGSGVNVDQEMANLLTLQTAYGANARVMTTIKQMLDMLMQI